jgi:sugar lactone lactonase YvrE
MVPTIKEKIMKRNSKITRTLASLLMSLTILTGASFAATKPVNGPWGITLDSKGNLWVANYSGNQILVYNPSYKQIRVITNSIDGPSGVAFDPYGILYVSNINSSAVTWYTSTGAYLGTFNSFIQNPAAIATDAIGNVWVQNNDGYIVIYAPSLFYQQVQVLIAGNLGFNFFLEMATHNSQVAIGTDQGFQLSTIDLVLQNATVGGSPDPTLTGNSLAFDAAGNIYSGNLDGTVDYFNLSTHSAKLFTTVGYPKGIAVDNARGRVYISDFFNNDILVYNPSGTLLTTIK